MVGFHQILAGRTTTKAVSSSGVVVTLERNVLLRLRSNINIKKITETRFKKSIGNVKRCRDGMPKSMQTR